MTTYTKHQQDHIDRLAQSIEANPVSMAVVDYLGRRDADGLVTDRTENSRRFGTRDLRHVAIYGLEVVSLNAKAREKS